MCHEGIRGVNGTSFDSNIVITTTDGFDDLGTWHSIERAGATPAITDTPRPPPTVDSPPVAASGVHITSDEPPPLLATVDDEDPPLAIYMDQQIEDRRPLDCGP